MRTIEDEISNEPVLTFYNPNENLTVQVDSRRDGIGLVSLHNGKPIEYTSLGLISAERKWAQTEKETVVFGLEPFL